MRKNNIPKVAGLRPEYKKTMGNHLQQNALKPADFNHYDISIV